MLIIFYNARSQFINPPSLNCVRTLNNQDVRLDWTNTTNSCGRFLSYNIFRSTSIDPTFTLIHTEYDSLVTFYTDPVGNGNRTVYYYFMNSSYTCGLPTLNSDTIDNLDPVPPEINYVTVINGKVELNWKPSISPETYGYIIYLFDLADTFSQPIDTIYGSANTTYTDLINDPGSGSLYYDIAAIDSCFSTGPINTSFHRTIFLTENTERCEHYISIAWNSYDNWPNGVQNYKVYMGINNTAPVLVDSLPPTANTDTIRNFNDGDLICLTVIAEQASGPFTSASNTICTTPNVVQLPNDFYIRNVTVAQPGQVDVYYSLDPLADILNIEIDRSIDGISYKPIATIPPSPDLSGINIYSDNSAYPDYQSFYYRLITVDSCNMLYTSSSGKSILLSGYSFGDFTNYLNWDSSVIDFSTVTGFNIYRDEGNGFSLVASLSNSAFTYQESNSTLGDTVCYYVEALHSAIFPNGTIDQVASHSNILCLKPPSQIYAPNAFAPFGNNQLFKPILNVRNITFYQLTVFNRWGLKIFSSTDPEAGWDGKYNGIVVQQGTYAYFISVSTSDNQKIEKKGTVMVVR
ncbi:MAG: gliding motility-associated C-terminal domain-containing protein [Chitinophagales bacterium]|nr:gliding motility-associated C-terminal domain-containing protein [Chitinophagales bacterium]